MSDNPKDEAEEDGHYDDTPGARTDMVQGSTKTRDEYFADLLEKWGDEISSQLPSTVSRQKFMNSAIAAVKNNPGIVECTPRSIYTALTQSASDGLLPDGKEGVITAYKNKSGKKEAKWNPMAHGIRKRARELDSIIIDAQVVHEKDAYKRTQGDCPSIIHEPADHLPDRGLLILTYAIFKREDGNILHREVMNRQQVMDVKAQSKQPDGLMWTKFETEGWRKSVIRRGIKTVPVSERLMQVVTRDDDNFSLEHQAQEQKPITPPPAPPPAPKATPPALENKPGVTLDASVKKEPEKVLAETRADTVYDQRTPAPRTQTEPESHDAETGEVGPRAIPVPVEGGKERFAPWGKSLIEAIMASKTHAEVDAWREANKFILERCEQTAPKAYASVQKAISQRANELMEGQKESPKGTPEAAAPPDAGYKDWLRDAYAELAQCMNELAVEELRERISDELKAADQISWRDACAEKATELFGGKRR